MATKSINNPNSLIKEPIIVNKNLPRKIKNSKHIKTKYKILIGITIALTGASVIFGGSALLWNKNPNFNSNATNNSINNDIWNNFYNNNCPVHQVFDLQAISNQLNDSVKINFNFDINNNKNQITTTDILKNIDKTIQNNQNNTDLNIPVNFFQYLYFNPSINFDNSSFTPPVPGKDKTFDFEIYVSKNSLDYGLLNNNFVTKITVTNVSPYHNTTVINNLKIPMKEKNLPVNETTLEAPELFVLFENLKTTITDHFFTKNIILNIHLEYIIDGKIPNPFDIIPLTLEKDDINIIKNLKSIQIKSNIDKASSTLTKLQLVLNYDNSQKMIDIINGELMVKNNPNFQITSFNYNAKVNFAE